MLKFKTIAEIYRRYKRGKFHCMFRALQSLSASSGKSPQTLYTRNLKALFVDFKH